MVKCGEFVLDVVFKSIFQAIIMDIIISERDNL